MLVHGTNRRGRQTRLYLIWRDVIARCYNPDIVGSKMTAGRGVTMQESWKRFETFHALSQKSANRQVTVFRKLRQRHVLSEVRRS